MNCLVTSWLSAVQRHCLAPPSTSASSLLSWEPASTWWETPSITGSFWVAISSICQSERIPSSKTSNLHLWSVESTVNYTIIFVFLFERWSFIALFTLAHANLHQLLWLSPRHRLICGIYCMWPDRNNNTFYRKLKEISPKHLTSILVRFENLCIYVYCEENSGSF